MGNLTPELAALRDETRDLAKSYGLDFYEVIFELVDHDELNMIASYGGFPTRYPHWRFGMEYEHLTKSYAYGLSKIYELVINNDPCYAYLMRSNALTEQKLVMAHVYGHCDFFKNNAWFAHTSRKMMDALANHGSKIRRYMDRHGQERVENFIDLVHSLDNLIDPYSPYIDRGTETRPGSGGKQDADDERPEVRKIAAKDYMDRYINPPEFMKRERERMEKDQRQSHQFPARPARDVLKFLLDHAPLQTWEQDVMAMLRDEAYYFAPQGMTKIMNEGWAVFWHSTLMTRHLCDASEIVQYCDTHSGTLATRPGQINPYKMGVELFRDIEQRWNHGRFGQEYQACDDPELRRKWDRPTNEGRAKVFEVRRIYNDVTFIDEFVTPEFAEDQKMFVYGQDPQTGQLVILDRDYRKVKEQLLAALTNFGNPIIKVVDGNHKNRGELYLVHEWVGGDLQLDQAQMTLQGLFRIWQRPVHIETIESGKGRLLSFDGTTATSTEVTASHPATGRVGAAQVAGS
ncbi:MAG TPA: SpoVR family protein [Planctomycetota bacterium]|nr:SpoVR family protein [Planctomycetota bacterium]